MLDFSGIYSRSPKTLVFFAKDYGIFCCYMSRLKKESFVFYRSFLEAAEVLKVDVKTQFILAVIDYGLNGKEPVFEDKISKALFAAVRPSLDSQRKQEKTTNNTKKDKRFRRVSDCSSPELFLSTRGCTKEAKAEFIRRYILDKEPFDVPDSINIISTMPYGDFLKTPYWKAISTYVKNNANRHCQICGSRSDLCVHHKTYQNHGDELNHLDDLICVCSSCHGKIHDKNPETTH